MLKNNPKIYQRTATILLAIIISGLLNICMFSFQAKAAQPIQQPKFNFVYNNGGNCIAEPMPEPTQSINYPAAPVPECCLAQNRNFDALVSTANDKTATAFTNPEIYPSDNLIPENNSTYYTSQNIYPPPATLALASTVIRE